ncbi:YfbM family protein [Streptomyces decoyicus]|uniref:YfbM family protein n=1 Tax=Streptomyces decoyicus TaxID=249567 RepID=UPI002E36EAF6|nr:YfbM family protein [Streptomyces decoyicus]
MGAAFMGMVISFTRVTPEELDRAEKDPDWAREFLWEVDELRPDNPEAYLDKAWAGLEFLLGKAGEPLEFLMDGYPVDDEGTLFSWGVEGVQALAKSLGALPWERLATHYDPVRMTEEEVYPDIWEPGDEDAPEYLKGNYETLVSFFDATARLESAALMSFSF